LSVLGYDLKRVLKVLGGVTLLERLRALPPRTITLPA